MENDDSFNLEIDGIKNYNNIDMIPYVKAIIDYSFFVGSKIAIVVGVNATYNFDIGHEVLKASPEGFYIGTHLVLKFSPKL